MPYPTILQLTPRARSVALASGLFAGLLASGAHAQDAAAPTFKFSGFGTAGVVHADYDQADFSSSIFKAEGAGGTRSVTANLDSRIGAQLDTRLNKQWSAVVQVLVEQRYNLSYKPQVEWANVKYQATPDLALRVGRIAMPIFLAADYRKVGYAYPWARTPNEVYGGVPITNSDGADVAYRWQYAGVKHVTQAFAGRTHINLTDSTNVEARRILGLTHTIESGALTLRASAFSARVDTDIARPLFDGFRRFGPAGIAIAARYDVIDKPMRVFALSLNYDPGQWFFMAEGGTANGNSFLAKSLGMYASAGYRIGDFTPYVQYSMTDARSPTSDPGLPLAGLPPAYAVPAAQLNTGLNVLLKTIATQSTVMAGVRWDFRPDMALKLQHERVLPKDGSRGTLINLKPGFESGRAVHVTSAVLDFVF